MTDHAERRAAALALLETLEAESRALAGARRQMLDTIYPPPEPEGGQRTGLNCRPRSAEVERIEALLGPYASQLTDGKRVVGPETPPPASPTATERQSPDLANFARRVAREHFENDSSGVEGDVLQDIAIETGVFVEVQAVEPCGKSCWCAEMDNIPGRCFRLSPELGGAA